jgi:putative Mg2+ transporter-C (MgtC) family protein
VIGFEREQHHKPAGVTTAVIVTLASTLVMQLGFRLAVMGGGVTPADPARLAAAVVTGIGFLGAGMIIRESRQVFGINTAATIWSMACVGLAIGAGAYFAAGCVTILIYGALVLERVRLDRLARRSGFKRRATDIVPFQRPPDAG